MIRIMSIIAVFIMLNACVNVPPQEKKETPSFPSELANCLDFYAEFDGLVDEANVRDAQASRLANYPFFRINRFLASFRDELESDEKFEYWLSLLSDLDTEARQIEWRNLPQVLQKNIEKKFLKIVSFDKYIAECSGLLRANLNKNNKREIINAAKIKDAYSVAQRFFGIYLVASFFVSREIQKQQAITRQLFDANLIEIPVKGKLARYVPPNYSDETQVEYDRSNPLKIPIIDPLSLEALFLRYAPILEIDEEDENDIVGYIVLDEKGNADFSSDQAVYYVLPSYTRFNDEVLLQLNYVFWFSSRPKKSFTDIYSGKLDGLHWRVTLDRNGAPLLYDSMHNCGCYHKFYLTDKVSLNQSVAKLDREPPFVAQKINKLPSQRLVLRIGSVAHYVHRVYPITSLDIHNEIKIKPYAELRSLEWGSKKRSMFSNNGLVHGTERSERWLLWPMGVPSAGAMRQWGHHAVAFVGKRHFDDPGLLDKYFSPYSASPLQSH